MYIYTYTYSSIDPSIHIHIYIYIYTHIRTWFGARWETGDPAPATTVYLSIHQAGSK